MKSPFGVAIPPLNPAPKTVGMGYTAGAEGEVGYPFT